MTTILTQGEGKKLISSAVMVKTLSFMTDKLMKKRAKKNLIGKLKNNQDKLIMKKMADGSLLPSFKTGAVGLLVAGAVASPTIDYYEGIDSESFFQAPEVVLAVVAMMGLNETMAVNLIDTVFYLMMFVGVLMAFVLPLLPYILIIIMLVTALIKLLSGMFLSIMCIVLALIPSEGDRNKYLVEAGSQMVTAVLYPFFISISVLIAIYFVNYVLPNLVIIETGTHENSFLGVIGFISTQVINIFIVYKMIAVVYGSMKDNTDKSISLIYGAFKLNALTGEGGNAGEKQVKTALKKVI